SASYPTSFIMYLHEYINDERYLKDGFNFGQAVLSAYQAIRPSTGSTFEALCIFNLPFTFIKGLLCAVVTMLVYKPLSPIIKSKDK
ncbi:MAG: hypothetical protein IKR76_11755, partial [Ruminococcus sp.]|nr:hypothetical protein [Ruminococcus sp.]